MALRQKLLAVLALLLAAACATGTDPVADTDQMAPITFTVDDYRLGAGDKVKVTVFGEPDLSGRDGVCLIASGG